MQRVWKKLLSSNRPEQPTPAPGLLRDPPQLPDRVCVQCGTWGAWSGLSVSPQPLPCCASTHCVVATSELMVPTHRSSQAPCFAHSLPSPWMPFSFLWKSCLFLKRKQVACAWDGIFKQHVRLHSQYFSSPEPVASSRQPRYGTRLDSFSCLFHFI